ncbi:MAG: hypothetical protein EB072_06970 [Betaproteobacteria bacterium]|nr:hypothetical protein [Betaproteobacteria bacterium]
MQVGLTLNTGATVTSDSSAPGSGSSKIGFAAVLEAQRAIPPEWVASESGRVAVQINLQGQITKMRYFDEQGRALRSSIFTAPEILMACEEFEIPLDDLSSLGKALDQYGIGFRPYELRGGSGSDHGVDFDDLIRGGLGSAYDWRKDLAAANKGPQAVERSASYQALALRTGRTLNSDVTSEQGIRADLIERYVSAIGETREFVVANGSFAAQYRTAAEAQVAAAVYGGGAVIRVSDQIKDAQAINYTPGDDRTADLQSITSSATEKAAQTTVQVASSGSSSSLGSPTPSVTTSSDSFGETEAVSRDAPPVMGAVSLIENIGDLGTNVALQQIQFQRDLARALFANSQDRKEDA